jgi:hypothetical protein
LSMTPSAKEGSYESQSLPGRNPKTATVQAIALGGIFPSIPMLLMSLPTLVNLSWG